MASNPPGKCCSVGVKHEGTATGKIEQIGGISTYVAYPADKSTTNAIVILTDIIGHEFINAQLVADQYAANGYFVVMPDLFAGDPVPLNMKEINFDLMAWLQNHLPPNVDPIVSTIIKELRTTYQAKRIGGVGYCFGGKYVCRFLKQGQLDVGYTAHPSFVDVDELKGIQGPLSISAAETDNIFPAEKRRETEDILKDMKVPYQMTLYSDVEHGFAVRCDIKDPRQRFAKEQAFFQAVQWFDEFLKQ